jgi:hypothetical protein
MPNTIHLPLLGNVPKGAAIAGGGAAVVVTAYLIYKHSKDAAVTSTGATGYGYGASAYGYGASSAFYGYGSEYANADAGSGLTPYPVASEYGYGAYGYGMYNPYTGQYIGPVQTTPPPVGGTGTGTTTPPKTTGPKSGWFTIGGKKEYYSSAKGTIGHWVGTGKKRKWVRTKV